MNFKSSFASLAERSALIFLAFAVVVAYVSQINYDTWRRYGDPKIKTTYNVFIEPQPLSPTLARAASFGATEFMADYYWLQFIQYYGGGDPYGKYRKLAELFNTVTDLSLKFEQAYQTGLVILPGEGFVNEAIVLGEKGQKNLPQSWEMPYYTGLVYHIYKKDFVRAAQEFQKAADLPGAPAITKLFVGIYYNKANDRQTAYLIFKTVYETSHDDFVRERAKKYVGHLEALFTLQDAVNTYKQKYGRLPANLNQLIEQKILPELPQSPLSISFSYDSVSGAIGEAKR